MFKSIQFLCLFLLFSVIIYAQDKNCEVRLSMNEPIDCESAILYADIQIRAASEQESFRLGYQYYRISFNSTVVDNPQISEELTISGIMQLPQGLTVYNPHFIVQTSPSDTVLTYVVEYGTGSGYLLDTNWVDVGRLSFDIKESVGCFNIYPHNNTTKFPSSAIEELTSTSEPPTVETIVNANFDGSLSGCIQDFCQFLPNEEIDSTPFISLSPNPVKDYLQISYTGLSNERINIQIVDLSGQTIKRELLDGNLVSVDDLLPGVYFIHLSYEKQKLAIKKFVKL